MKEEILENIYNSKRNVIIDGDMSTGKTKNIGYSFVKKIIDSNESLLILDSREEYLKKYYNELKTKNYNTIIINTKNFSKSEGWNILEYPYQLYKNNKNDDAIKYLDKITGEIFVDNNATDFADPFWLNSAKDYFTGIALALFQDAYEDEINLCSVNSVINESDYKVNYVAEYFRTKDVNDMSYVYASGTVFSPTDTMGGIISSAKQKLRPLVSKELLNTLFSKTTFNYNDILTKPTAIFFVNDETDTSLSMLASIFISQLYAILIDNNCKTNFNFILDNFDTINNIANLRDILSSSISNNIKFYIITRDKEYLEKKYSSYINKVSNSISLTEKEILIKINTETITLQNKLSEECETTSNINYPEMKKKEINLFNLKRFVLDNIKADSDM